MNVCRQNGLRPSSMGEKWLHCPGTINSVSRLSLTFALNTAMERSSSALSPVVRVSLDRVTLLRPGKPISHTCKQSFGSKKVEQNRPPWLCSFLIVVIYYRYEFFTHIYSRSNFLADAIFYYTMVWPNYGVCYGSRRGHILLCVAPEKDSFY